MKTMKFVRCSLLLLATVLFAGSFVLAQEGPLRDEQPNGLTVDQVVQKFAAKEQVFQQARHHYTWHQTIIVQTIDGGRVDGEYHSEEDVLFDSQGRRMETVTYAPESTLTRIMMTQQDFEDIEKRMPFVLTTDEIPLYNIKYVGQQQEDELNTYVFDISPKTIEKNRRYFDGRIWVDDHDFQIVKTYGKSVPDIVKSKDNENLFPRFTTWRQQIDGKYWFPAYTRVDDVLHFSNGDVHVRQIVKYTNYRYFGANVKITYQGKEVEKSPDAKQTPPQENPPPKK